MNKLKYYVMYPRRWWWPFSDTKELTRSKMYDMITSELQHQPARWARDIDGNTRLDLVATQILSGIEGGAATRIHTDRLYFSSAFAEIIEGESKHG